VTEVAVVDYGAGNTRSVRAALSRLGLSSRVTSDPGALEGADLVVLPGVGSARTAMDHLARSGGDDALRRRFAASSPILGICLGLQLAVDSSDEDGGVTGLGLVSGTVHRLETARVPRIGWAMVEPWGETYFFAHSYAVTSPDVVATSEGVTAAVSRGSFFGVQFHPEKSGAAGLAFLESCLTRA
jgi:glutamine amidotransferase